MIKQLSLLNNNQSILVKQVEQRLVKTLKNC